MHLMGHHHTHLLPLPTPLPLGISELLYRTSNEGVVYLVTCETETEEPWVYEQALVCLSNRESRREQMVYMLLQNGE